LRGLSGSVRFGGLPLWVARENCSDIVMTLTCQKAPIKAKVRLGKYHQKPNKHGH
jgi:hypothetical protein